MVTLTNAIESLAHSLRDTGSAVNFTIVVGNLEDFSAVYSKLKQENQLVLHNLRGTIKSSMSITVAGVEIAYVGDF